MLWTNVRIYRSFENFVFHFRERKQNHLIGTLSSNNIFGDDSSEVNVLSKSHKKYKKGETSFGPVEQGVHDSLFGTNIQFCFETNFFIWPFKIFFQT